MGKALIRAADVSDLVWLQTGFIGDIILTTAAIHLARQYFPRAKQHIITTAIGAQVLSGHADLSSCIVYAKGKAPALAAMRQVRRDLDVVLPSALHRQGVVLLQAHRSYRSSFLAKFLRLPTITYRQSAGGVLALRRVDRVAVLHEASRIALLLEPLGVPRLDMMSAKVSMPIRPLLEPSGWQQQLRQWPGPVVAIAPGSVWGTKRWPEAAFAELLRRCLRRDDLLVLLLGSAAEAPLATRLAQTAPAGHPRLLNLAGQTSFDDLKALYPRLSLLVANDSSPIHLASAYAVATVALFGATVPAMGFGPLAPGSVVLGTDLDCRPCSDHGPKECPLGHFKCMRDLAVDRVWAACCERLPAKSQAAGC